MFAFQNIEKSQVLEIHFIKKLPGIHGILSINSLINWFSIVLPCVTYTFKLLGAGSSSWSVFVYTEKYGAQEKKGVKVLHFDSENTSSLIW